MELHEYEWELREMVGREPSDLDIWVAGGSACDQHGAEKEATYYLSQYANDDTGFRFEVFEVTRKSLGGLARVPDA
jgi:hypothetical protein